MKTEKQIIAAFKACYKETQDFYLDPVKQALSQGDEATARALIKKIPFSSVKGEARFILRGFVDAKPKIHTLHVDLQTEGWIKVIRG